MAAISHRDLRNRSGEILRAVAAGESFTITNAGKPVARLIPLDEAEEELPRVRPRRVVGGFTGLSRLARAERTADVLDELRGDR
ncbi:type II toxin-antitoxin system Phd/YefM family antitoxin [Salana multivorans]